MNINIWTGIFEYKYLDIRKKYLKEKISSVSLKALIGRQSYYQVIRGRFREIQRGLSKCKEDKNFAPKQNERDCPMTDNHIFTSVR